MLEKAHEGGVATWQEEGMDGGVVQGVKEERRRPSSQGDWGVDPQSRPQAPVWGVVCIAQPPEQSSGGPPGGQTPEGCASTGHRGEQDGGDR